MLMAKIGSDIGCHVEMTGNVVESATDVCNLIQNVHSLLGEDDSFAAMAFRGIVSSAILAGKIWGEKEGTP